MDRNTMQNLYKSRNDPVRNIENKKNDYSKKMKIQRQDRRTRMFNERRSIFTQNDIENMSENVSTNDQTMSSENVKANARKLALQKYRLEREAIKQALKVKKKPPFVVGIPHHGNSPILKTIIGTQKKQNEIEPSQEVKNKRVTRAHTKLEQGNIYREENAVFKSPVRVFPFIARKSEFIFQHNKITGLKKLTSPQTPTVLKRSAQKIQRSKGQNTAINNVTKNEMNNSKPLKKVLRKVLEPKEKSSTSSTISMQIPAAPLRFSNVSEQSIQQDQTDASNRQIQISPEQKISVKTEISEDQGESNSEVALQREKVDKESDRLLSLAEEWETIALQNTMPRDVVDEIDSVVGQTRLLTRDKFNQFRKLIDQYESQQGSHRITIEDLNGFWDMMYLQVELLIQRYTKLAILKSNNWEELKPVTPAKRKRKGHQKRKVMEVEDTTRNQQESSQSIVKEEVLTVKTPYDEKKHFQINNLSRNSHTPRRHSPSPYIAMRLSAVGRSLMKSSPTMVEVLKCTQTPRSIVKTEPKSGDLAKEKAVLNHSEEILETVECTPRRSIRLMGRTPVPQTKLCSTCQSPDCSATSSCNECKQGVKPRLRRSQKTVSTPAVQKLEDLLTESSTSSCQKEDSVKLKRPRQSKRNCALSPDGKLDKMPLQPSNSANVQEEATISSKRFVLRPSKLAFYGILNKSPVPEKTRRTFVVEKENVEDEESSSIIRRSTRIASATKKVTFNSSPKEKINFKLPATPYGKRGHSRESFSESPSD